MAMITYPGGQDSYYTLQIHSTGTCHEMPFFLFLPFFWHWCANSLTASLALLEGRTLGELHTYLGT